MTTGERRSATRQLAVLLRNLHGVRCPEHLPAIDAAPQLLANRAYDVVEPLLLALDGLVSMPHVDPRLVESLRDIVEDTQHVLEPFDTANLVHGDLHFENVLWDGRAITALLDFEWARGGPPDLDLDVLLRFCAYPYLHVAEDYEALTLSKDYAPVPYWLAEDYPELFGHPHLLERVRLYCIAYDVRELLTFPPPKPPTQLSPHHPGEPARPHGAGHQPPRPAGRRARPRAPVGLQVGGGPSAGSSLSVGPARLRAPPRRRRRRSPRPVVVRCRPCRPTRPSTSSESSSTAGSIVVGVLVDGEPGVDPAVPVEVRLVVVVRAAPQAPGHEGDRPRHRCR